MRSRTALASSVLTALAAAALTSGCGGNQSALNPAGPQAETIARVTWWFLAVCGLTYALTMGALFWAIFRRRATADDAPETSTRLGWIIAVAVGLTIVTLVGLTVASVAASRGLSAPPVEAAVTVEVIGHQWWWEFRYQGATPHEWVNSPNELRIPVGVPVAIKATSRDVIHSFWVPNLHGKRDLVPGMATHTWIQADRPGVYRGQCGEFCGHQHANMAFEVIAQPMDEFRAWLEHQRRAAPEPDSDLASRGRDLFVSGPCAQCHTVRGTPAGSRVGPDLTHVAGRRTLAAGTLPMTRGHLSGWVADAQSVKPGSRMPPNLVSGEDLRAIVAYLETLR